VPGFFTRGGSRSARPPSRIEEVFYPAVLNDPNVDTDLLTELLRDPSPLMVDEPEPPQPPPPSQERALIRVAKLAGLVTAVALLCGAIVAAAFLDRQRRSTPPPTVDSSITGVRALAAIAGDGVTAVPLAERPGGASSSQGATQRPGGAQPAEPREVARKFYSYIGGQPDIALSMLGGELTDAERAELAVAWQNVTAVKVDELRIRPDGLVRAVVRMTTEAGGEYRLDHLLRVDSPTITEVRLLSARHSPPGSS